MVVLLVIFLVLKLIEYVTGIDDCTRRVKEDEHGLFCVLNLSMFLHILKYLKIYYILHYK